MNQGARSYKATYSSAAVRMLFGTNVIAKRTVLEILKAVHRWEDKIVVGGIHLSRVRLTRDLTRVINER